MEAGKSGGRNEPYIVAVGEDWRIVIPQQVSQAVAWLSGTEPVTAELLVGGYGRHRLLAPNDMASPELQELRNRISTLASRSVRNPLDFGDSAEVTLSCRLLAVELRWSQNKGWRLTLPMLTTTLWRLERKGSSVAVLLSQGYIEVWSLQAVESAFAVPLEQLV